eukprot:s3381_g5.t1
MAHLFLCRKDRSCLGSSGPWLHPSEEPIAPPDAYGLCIRIGPSLGSLKFGCRGPDCEDWVRSMIGQWTGLAGLQLYALPGAVHAQSLCLVRRSMTGRSGQ